MQPLLSYKQYENLWRLGHSWFSQFGQTVRTEAGPRRMVVSKMERLCAALIGKRVKKEKRAKKNVTREVILFFVQTEQHT